MRSSVPPGVTLDTLVRLGRAVPSNEPVVLGVAAIEIGAPLASVLSPLTPQPPAIAFTSPFWFSDARPAPNGSSYEKLVTSRCAISKAEYDLSRSRRLLSENIGLWFPP